MISVLIPRNSTSLMVIGSLYNARYSMCLNRSSPSDFAIWLQIVNSFPSYRSQQSPDPEHHQQARFFDQSNCPDLTKIEHIESQMLLGCLSPADIVLCGKNTQRHKLVKSSIERLSQPEGDRYNLIEHVEFNIF